MDQSALPPFVAVAVIEAAPASRPFASGIDPSWQLAQVGGGLQLTIGTDAPIPLTPGVWQTTIDGRVLLANTLDGRTVTLHEANARCTDGRGTLARLTIGGRQLAGCINLTGERPYDAR